MANNRLYEAVRKQENSTALNNPYGVNMPRGEKKKKEFLERGAYLKEGSNTLLEFGELSEGKEIGEGIIDSLFKYSGQDPARFYANYSGLDIDSDEVKSFKRIYDHIADNKRLTYEIKRPEPKKRNFDLKVPITVREREKNLIDDFLEDTIYKNYRDDDILRSDNPTEALDGYKQIESKIKNEDPKVANAIKKQFIQEKESQYSIVSGEPEMETKRVWRGPQVGYDTIDVEKPKVQGLTDEEVNVLVELEKLRPQFAEIYENVLKNAQPEVNKEIYDPIAGDFYDLPGTSKTREDVAYQQTLDQMQQEGKIGDKAYNLLGDFLYGAVPIGGLSEKQQAELMIQASPGERFIVGGAGILAGYGMAGKIGKSADTYRKVTRGVDRYLSGVKIKSGEKIVGNIITDPVKARKLAEISGRASSSAQTFGTYTLTDMLDEDISTGDKVNEVLHSVFLGTGLGATGTIASPFKRIPAEGLVGFTNGLMETGDPKEATLNALLFMGFGLMNRQNLKQDERRILWERLGDDFISYFRHSLKNPNLTKEQRQEARKFIISELRKKKANLTSDELRNEIESVKKQILYGMQKMTASKQTEKAIQKQIAGEMTRHSQAVAKKVKKSVKVPETGKPEVLSKENVLKMSIDQQVKELKGLGYTEEQLVRLGGDERANIIADAVKPVNYYGEEQPKPKIEIKRPEKPVEITKPVKSEEAPSDVKTIKEPRDLPFTYGEYVTEDNGKWYVVNFQGDRITKKSFNTPREAVEDTAYGFENITDQEINKKIKQDFPEPDILKEKALKGFNKLNINEGNRISVTNQYGEKVTGEVEKIVIDEYFQYVQIKPDQKDVPTQYPIDLITKGKLKQKGNVFKILPKKIEKPVKEEPKSKKPISAKPKKAIIDDVVSLDPKQVKIDESKFQPREEYNQAVIDNIAKDFNITKWDPPLVWQDPSSKDYFVVSGHHRQKGVVKGGITDGVTYKVLPKGTTLEEARDEAGVSNLQATEQSDFETAAEIRRRIERGDSYDAVAKEMPGLFKGVKNKTDKLKKMEKLAYLDPKGKFKENFDNQSQFPRIISNARQIGSYRKAYDWFTDKYESDVFQYLYQEGGISKDQDLFGLGLMRNLEKLDKQTDKPESIIKLLRKEPVKPAENTHTEVLKVVDDLKAQIKTLESKLNSDIEINKLIDARLNGSGTITEKNAPEIEKEIRDNLKKELRQYKKDLLDLIDKTNAPDPSQAGLFQDVKKWDTKESYDLHDTAKKIFGTTEDPREAGYILLDGEMLDFSGKSQGGTPGTRSFDHRQINEVGDSEMGGKDKFDDVGMSGFIKSGAIRYMPEGNKFHLGMEKPDQPQLARMRKLLTGLSEFHKAPKEIRDLYRYPDHITITITDGDILKYEQNYEIPTSWEFIKRDILQFYRTGKGPSITQQFLMQDVKPFNTKSTAFKKWFGDSKVVDENGEPLVVYHGTDKDFEEFSVGKNVDRKGREKNPFYLGELGSWFTAKTVYPADLKRAKRLSSKIKEMEQEYKNRPDMEPYIDSYRRDLKRAEKPRVSEGYDEGGAEFMASAFSGTSKAENRQVYPVYLSINNPFIVYGEEIYSLEDISKERLQKQGYDGIRIVESMTDGNVVRDDWVAFKPTQIKSQFNQGTFDPKDPRILMQSLDQYNMFGGMDKIKPVNATKRAELDVILDELHSIHKESEFLEKQADKNVISGIKYKKQSSELRKRKADLELQRMKLYGESRQVGLFQSVDAYHGSPHTFKKFKMSAMGTGEGVQAYGHGLYFSDLEGVGRFYANMGGNHTKDYRIGALQIATLDKDGEPDWMDYSPHILEREWYKYQPYIRKDHIQKDANKLAEIIEDLMIFEYEIRNNKDNYKNYLTDYFKDKIASIKDTKDDGYSNDIYSYDILSMWDYEYNDKQYRYKSIKEQKALKDAFFKEYKDDFVGKIRIYEELLKSVKKDDFNYELEKTKNLYKVKLKSQDPNKMNWLDWYDDISESEANRIYDKLMAMKKGEIDKPEYLQVDKIDKQELSEIFSLEGSGYENDPIVSGRQLYDHLSYLMTTGGKNEMFVSKFLNEELGYDGNRFLAQGGSGGKTGDKYNYVVFDEEAIEIDTHTLYQNMKDWDKLKNPYRPKTNETQKETAKILRKELQAKLPGENSLPPRRRRYTIQGNGITEPLARKGFVSLVGTRVSSTRELASASQILRDPRYETARLFYVKNDKIVHQSAITSRLPGAIANLFPGDVFPMINQNMKNFEADGFYLLHNHPGGDSKPSSGDEVFTKLVYQSYPKSFKGHVVINSNNYSTIRGKGADQPVPVSVVSERHEVDFGKDKLLQPSKPHPWLGTKLDSLEDLERLGRKIQDRGFITLLNLSSDSSIRGVIDVPLGTLDMSSKRVMATLRDIARKTGSVQSIAVVGGYDSGITKGQMERLIEMTEREAITSVVMNNGDDMYSISDSNSQQIFFEQFKKQRPPKVIMRQPVKKFKSNRQKALARAHILEAEIGLAEKEKKLLKKSITGYESLGEASDPQISAYINYLLEQKYGAEPISKPTIAKKTLKQIREERLLDGDKLEKSILERASKFLDKPKDFLGKYWVYNRQSMQRTLEKMGEGGQNLVRMYKDAEYYHFEKVKPLEAEMERLWKKVPSDEKELIRNIIESDGASDLSSGGQAFLDYWGRLTDDIYNEGKKYMNPDLAYIDNYFPLQLKMDFYKEINPKHKLWDSVIDHVEQVLNDRISQEDIFGELSISREEAEQYVLDFLRYYNRKGIREHFIQQVFKPSGKFNHSYPLEMHRDRIFPEWAYEQNLMEVAHGYIDKSYEAISHAKEFGKIDDEYKYENIDTQLDLIERDGFERKLAEDIMGWSMGLKSQDRYEQTMNKMAKNITSFLLSPQTTFKNLTDLAKGFSQSGTIRTFESMARLLFSKKDRQLANDLIGSRTVFKQSLEKTGVGSGVASFYTRNIILFTRSESGVRQVVGHSRILQAEHLLKNYDPSKSGMMQNHIRRVFKIATNGLNIDKIKKRGYLNRSEKLRIGNHAIGETQPASELDRPINWVSKGFWTRKSIFQSFSHKALRWTKDFVLKELKHGNPAPLINLLVWRLSLGYAYQEAIRWFFNTKPEEEETHYDRSWKAFTETGEIGLLADLLFLVQHSGWASPFVGTLFGPMYGLAFETLWNLGQSLNKLKSGKEDPAKPLKRQVARNTIRRFGAKGRGIYEENFGRKPKTTGKKIISKRRKSGSLREQAN